jgi:hypothetical protein
LKKSKLGSAGFGLEFRLRLKVGFYCAVHKNTLQNVVRDTKKSTGGTGDEWEQFKRWEASKLSSSLSTLHSVALVAAWLLVGCPCFFRTVQDSPNLQHAIS